MKVHASQVTCRIVALIIPFTCLTGLAIRKERLVRRRVDGHPHLARLSMDAIGVPA